MPLAFAGHLSHLCFVCFKDECNLDLPQARVKLTSLALLLSPKPLGSVVNEHVLKYMEHVSKKKTTLTTLSASRMWSVDFRPLKWMMIGTFPSNHFFQILLGSTALHLPSSAFPDHVFQLRLNSACSQANLATAPVAAELVVANLGARLQPEPLWQRS